MLIVIAACAAICLAGTAAVADAAFPGDNGRIAYTRTLDSGASDLFSVEPSGFAEIRLTHDGQSDNGAFSPDGARFAYSSGTAIHIADQYGNDPELVLDTGVGVGEIDWSPDGTQLVASIMNCAEFDCEYDIYVVGTDGSGLTNLTGTALLGEQPVVVTRRIEDRVRRGRGRRGGRLHDQSRRHRAREPHARGAGGVGA